MAAQPNDDRRDDSVSPRHDPARFRDEDEMDRMAREGGKTEWQERSAPAAGDPVSDDERRGLNILAQNDPRGDGSLHGVSEPNGGDVRATEPVVAPREGERRNPPAIE
jgi:hypothetical protein